MLLGVSPRWDPAPFIRGARFRHGAEAALSDAAAFDSVLVDDFGAMVGCRCSAEVLPDPLRGRRAAAPPEQLVLDADGLFDPFVFKAPRAARRGAQPQALRDQIDWLKDSSGEIVTYGGFWDARVYSISSLTEAKSYPGAGGVAVRID